VDPSDRDGVGADPDPRLEPSASYIADVQREDGLIPWYADGPADPWDHVESAMGLSVAGRTDAAERAYEWLAGSQHDDGGWWAAYGAEESAASDHEGEDPRKETHRAAYAAVGVWTHYRVTGDRSFLAEHWPTVRDAVEFALAQQADTGEIYWTVDEDGEPHEDALVSGCASVYKSLAAAAGVADRLGRPDRRDRWLDARARLGTALREHPGRFDRTWESKSRYAMDWYYPVLCGAVRGDRARERLDRGWDRFVEPGLGCRCVADEPWVTVAESCELALALAAVGRRDRAREVSEWQFQWTDDEGVFWTGYQLEDEEFWPGERPTWTGGAALLAGDALARRTGACDVFTDHAPE
jgi:hypothetical protein